MEETFFITCDTGKCVACHACEAACKAVNRVEPGVKLRWVETYWQGEFPKVSSYSQSIGCHHCDDAPCVNVCPSGAIRQNELTKAVIVYSKLCEGCQSCYSACPYQIPQFGKDGKMQKCNLCFDSVIEIETPVCVCTCPSRALSLNKPFFKNLEAANR